MSAPPGRRTNQVPSRRDWPEPAEHTTSGALLTDVVIATFRLNGQLLEVAQELAACGGLTAAWWQVLGGILDQPRTIADIGRRMGQTRQGVQRVADLLVEQGLAEYRPNPAHRRSHFLACTDAGHWAIRQVAVAQHPWANRAGAEVGADQLRKALMSLRQISAVLENRSAEDRR